MTSTTMQLDPEAARVDALARQEQSAELHYRYYELLYYLRQNDGEHDNTQRYFEEMKKQVVAAQRLVKPEDEVFLKVSLAE